MGTAGSAAISAGHRVFGENRIQEAEGKWPEIKADHPDVTLHLLGPLQRNKVRRAVQLFDVIETVDRDRLARALAGGRCATSSRFFGFAGASMICRCGA